MRSKGYWRLVADDLLRSRWNALTSVALTLWPIALGVSTWLLGVPNWVLFAVMAPGAPIALLLGYLHARAIWERQVAKTEALEAEWRAYTRSSPLLVVDYTEVKSVQIRDPSTDQPLARPFIGYVHFLNSPQIPSENSIAQKVVAHVTLIKEYGPRKEKREAFSTIGRWSPSAKGEIISEIDIPPNGLPASLELVVKRRGDSDCYVLSNRSVEADPVECCDPEYRVESGLYVLRVALRGVNVQQTFQFSLMDMGAGFGDSPSLALSKTSG